MLVALALCVSASASIGFISHSLRKAPEGWEDHGGFQYGKQPAMVRPARARFAGLKPHLFPLSRRHAGLTQAALN